MRLQTFESSLYLLCLTACCLDLLLRGCRKYGCLYSELFGEGVFIYYTRTNGINGNISPRTLTQLELPTDGDWANVDVNNFSVENSFSATSGANAETIAQAYDNFKKTIGTFETLVTCRDYMNKIYSMVDDAYGKPLVSNVLVTDIRNDINRAITICSCDNAGIFYKETPISEKKTVKKLINDAVIEAQKPVFDDVNKKWCLGSVDGFVFSCKSTFIKGDSSKFSLTDDGTVSAKDGYWVITQNGHEFTTSLPSKLNTNIEADITEKVPDIDHFSLVIYPFKSYIQTQNTITEKDRVQKAYNNLRPDVYNPKRYQGPAGCNHQLKRYKSNV